MNKKVVLQIVLAFLAMNVLCCIKARLKYLDAEVVEEPTKIIFEPAAPALPPMKGITMFVTYSCDEEVLVTTVKNEPKQEDIIQTINHSMIGENKKCC